MSTPNIRKATIGDWRQAVESFRILYPHNRFNWNEAATTVPRPQKAPLTKSSPRMLAMTHWSIDNDDMPDRVTAVSAISVVHTDVSRLATVETWVSRVAHQGIGEELDVDRFYDTAQYAGHVTLDVDFPNATPFQEAHGNTPIVDIAASVGMDSVRTVVTVEHVVRASEVITALTKEYVDIPKVFPVIG
jgi:hypothetical protein